MKQVLLIIASTFLSYNNTFAQKNNLTESAIVITTSNDTLEGLIEMENEKSILKSFKFHDKENKVLTFQASDVKKLILTKYDIHFESLTYKSDIRITKQTILAKVLSKGIASLYKIEGDPVDFGFLSGANPFYMITTTKGTFPLLSTDNNKSKYKGMLNYLFKDCDKITDILNAVNYSGLSLQKALNQYNTCIDSQSFTENRSVNKSGRLPTSLSHNIVVGAIYTPSYTTIKESTKFKNMWGYSVGYYFDFLNPSISKRLSTSVGIQYFNFKEQVISDNNPPWEPETFHIIDLNVIKFQALGNYKMNFGKVVSIFQAGLSQEFTTNKLNLSYPNLLIGFGVKWKDFMLGTSTEFPIFLLRPNRNNMLQLKFAYAFLKSKQSPK